MARESQINPTGGLVTVSLSIDNALISGGNFKIYDFNTGVVNEIFPLQTGTTGNGLYEIKITSSNLVGQVLSWQVLTCSPINTDNGTLNIEIFQNGTLCPTIPLASYNLNLVPNCALNLALPAQGGLHFIKLLN